MRLSDYLARNNLTLDEFSGEIGVSRSAASRYANGLRFPARDVLERIRVATRGKVTANDFAHDWEAA